MEKKAGAIGIHLNPNFAYGLLAAFFLFYVISGNWIFGALAGLCIVWAVGLEFFHGARQHGVKNELKETMVALFLALAVWFGSGFILQTPSPINAIVSCSLLPHVQRGDMVLLRGDRIEAPAVQVPSLDGIGTATAYENNTRVLEAKGSLYSYCSQNRGGELCGRFIRNPQDFTERQGPLYFGYEKCEVLYPKTGQTQYGPCVSWLEVGGTRYYENITNDIIVYQPDKDEYYSRVGDIIHRAFVKLQTPDGKQYILTKGDNNPVFDVQVYDEKTGMGNRPVEISKTKGRVLLAVPYIGYLKLFISPAAIPTPDGCDRVYAKWEKYSSLAE